MQDLYLEITERIEKKQRTLVTTLTKKFAEDLSQYFQEKKIGENHFISNHYGKLRFFQNTNYHE